MIKSNQPTPRFNTEVSNVNRNSLYYQLLINGNFDIWQEATTVAAASASDGVTYVSDQWYNVQSTTAKWNFALESTIVPIGSTYSLKCSASDVNIQVGVIQPIEFVNATKYRGKTASISFQAITTAGKTIDNLRCALVNWTGTADTLTRDIVGTWAGNGTNPTLIANTTILNTPVNLPLTTSWKTFKIENILIPLTVNNLLLFIWTDDTTITSGDEFYVAQVQVNEGTIALPFYPKDYNTELTDCMRYYEPLFPPSTDFCFIVSRYSATGCGAQIFFRVIKHKDPILWVTGSNPYGRLVLYDTSFGVATVNVTGAAISQLTKYTCQITFTNDTYAGTSMQSSFDTNTMASTYSLISRL